MSTEGLIETDKCRICLQDGTEMESLFNIYCEDVSLASVFKSITGYEIHEDDRLPKKICISCKTTIINFNNMVSILQDTEAYFKKILYKEEEVDCVEAYIPHSVQEEVIFDKNNLSDMNDNGDYSEDEINESLYNNNNTKVELVEETMEVKKKQDFVYKEQLSDDGEYKFSNAMKYTCECGDVYLFKMGFRYHMQFKHNTILDEADFESYSQPIQVTIPIGSSSPVEYVSPRQLLKRDKLQCRICLNKFPTAEEVKAHEEVHKTHICDQCGAAFLKKHYLQDHQLMHSEERKYRCKLCGKSFKHRHTLSVHKKTHEDARGFICEVCGDSFRARATLYTHTLLKHSNVKNFPCPSCNLRFNLKSSRDKHYVRKHTFDREKSFVCSQCGAAYLNKTTLTRHIADKHLGQAKYFPCTICENKLYVMKRGLRTHMMKKHGIYDVK